MPIVLHNLLKAVAKGDEISFGELFDFYKQRIYAYAMHFTHSASVSEEIVQNIFIKLWLGKESLPGIDRFEAYLYTITRNLCFDYLKKLAREHAMKRKWSESVIISEESTDSATAYDGYENLLYQAVKKLPPQQKKIYTLSFYQEQKIEEIAELLHISPNTVKAHLVKARAAIRSHLSIYLKIYILFLSFFS